MGAGVLPFAVDRGKVQFLFQTVFSGRKTGYLIDFGGGVATGESDRACAVREFVEETETLYLADDLARASRSAQAVNAQVPLVRQLFDATLKAHPGWWCRRAPGDGRKPKRWKTFFVEFPYRDIAAMNDAWRNDTAGRFKKRRELIWVEADELIALYAAAPDRLWKRVRQLQGASTLVSEIQRCKAF